MAPTDHEKDIALEELDATRKQLEELSKRYEELEAKSKADFKFLAKEFKSLKSSQTTLKQELSQSLKEKSEVEVVYHFCISSFLNKFSSYGKLHHIITTHSTRLSPKSNFKHIAYFCQLSCPMSNFKHSIFLLN
jgi:hypothetical protein